MFSHLAHMKNLVAVFLGLSLLSAVSLSLLNMRHPNSMDSAVEQVQEIDCAGQIPAGNTCLEYHLGILDKISLAVPASFKALVQFLSLLLLAFVLAVLPISLTEKRCRQVLSRLRLLVMASKSYFNKQLGSWLKLLEQRNAAHNFLWRGFNFAVMPLI